MSLPNIEHLSPKEQQALAEFVQQLKEQFNGLVCSTLLFGSKARGESSPDSDLDVLVVVASSDWQVHKQIRYLAADLCLKYDLDLSPRVWSIVHQQEIAELQPHLYQNIQRDGIDLLSL